MMSGEDIVCFSKDWDESHTSNHHVLRQLARFNRVLWIDSTATRAPRLSMARDRRRIVRKLGQFARGPRCVSDSLWRFTPLVLPWPHSPLAAHVNRRILRASIRAATKRIGMETYQLWTFLPTVPHDLDDPRATIRVYYCTDEWTLFRGMDRHGIAASEQQVLQHVDLVFATSKSLVETKGAAHPCVLHAPHGVDHATFARALEATTSLPPELQALPTPRIGFHGTLDDWFDVELLIAVAARRPSWSFVLVGPQLAGADKLSSIPNIHALGVRAHSELWRYAAGYTAAVVPYRKLPRMQFVSPLKVREYLAAGLPVVSTRLPELESFRDVEVAEDPDGFVAALDRAVTSDSLAERRRRSDLVATDTWERRVDDLSREVMAMKASLGRAARAQPGRRP